MQIVASGQYIIVKRDRNHEYSVKCRLYNYDTYS